MAEEIQSVTREFPTLVLTERMEIRAAGPAYAEDVHSAIVESWESLHRWMNWAVTLPTSERTMERARVHAQRFTEGEILSMICLSRETGEFLASVGLEKLTAAEGIPTYSIGYWCRTSQHNRGYVTEAVNALTQAGFEHLGAQQMVIRCRKDNLASRAVAEKCGYQVESESADEEVPGRIWVTYVRSRG